MNRLFDRVSEGSDWLASRPLFFAGFNVVFFGMLATVGVDDANIFVSILTADLVLIGLGSARRDRLAVHAKLDELICVNKEARDDLIVIEGKSEAEIVAARKDPVSTEDTSRPRTE